MYYFYGVSNQIVTLGDIGELFISNCEHFLILDAVFEGTNDGIQIYDSVDIAFFNVSVSNSTNYLLQAENILNLTIMNSTFLYSESEGLYFYNVTNLVIKNCLISNISSYPVEFSQVVNVTFTNNWVMNFSEPIYVEDFENVTISDNCYGGNDTVWLEIYYNTGNETIILDNNLNQSIYNASFFAPATLQDLMNYWNRTAGAASGTNDTSATDDTAGTDDDGNSDDGLPIDDNNENLGDLWKKIVISAGAVLGTALIIWFVSQRKKEEQAEP